MYVFKEMIEKNLQSAFNTENKLKRTVKIIQAYIISKHTLQTSNKEIDVQLEKSFKKYCIINAINPKHSPLIETQLETWLNKAITVIQEALHKLENAKPGLSLETNINRRKVEGSIAVETTTY